MAKKDNLDCVNPERREFVKKLTTVAFVAPAVISVTMMDQKLNLSTANAASSNMTSPAVVGPAVPAG